MYPKKSMLDYMTEMNRFSRTGGLESDMFQSPTPLTRTSSFNQSMAQSSSSPETSPDSFPDLTPHQFPPEFRPEEGRKPDFYQRNVDWRRDQYENQLKSDYYDSLQLDAFEANFHPEHAFGSHTRPFESRIESGIYRNQHLDTNNLVLADHIHETPLIVRRQRPIMGRKIMATTEAPLKTINEFPIWQPNMPHTPPKSLDNASNIYELFPSENRSFEFPSPVKSSHSSPQLGSRVPLSPRISTPCVTPPPRSPFTPRMPTPFKEPMIGPSTSFTSYGSSKMCTLCRKNGETPLVYMTHTVKEKVGNRNVVTCPILRSHICSTCGASGDNAHTITYCPVLRSGNNGQPLQSTTITLKNTRVKSNGRRRY